MRFKLDENFDLRLIPLVAEGGHDVDAVLEEGLSGQPDEAIYQACITSPAQTEGIVVVRPPRAVLPLIRATLASALADLKARPLRGLLLIVEPGRIRMYNPQEETEA